MVLNVHRNHKTLLGTGRRGGGVWRWRKREIILFTGYLLSRASNTNCLCFALRPFLITGGEGAGRRRGGERREGGGGEGKEGGGNVGGQGWGIINHERGVTGERGAANLHSKPASFFLRHPSCKGGGGGGGMS